MAEDSLLDAIVSQGGLAETPRSRESLSGFVAQVMQGRVPVGRSAAAMVRQLLDEVDGLLSAQLNPVLHHPAFQRLEAAWRGLHRVVAAAENVDAPVLVRILDCSKRDLQQDKQSSAKVEESGLYAVLNREEAVPVSVVVADYEFGRRADDVEVLARFGQAAAKAQAPVLCNAAAGMLGLETFAEGWEQVPFRTLGKVFEGIEYAKWKSFRQSDDSRFVVVCLPPVLLRDLYPADRGGFQFIEQRSYLWGHSSWVLAEKIVESFGEYGWFAAIAGAYGGGMVDDLPAGRAQGPMQVATGEMLFGREGLMALVQEHGAQRAVFFDAPTAHKPKAYVEAEATESAQLAARLPYLLTGCRFAHGLRVTAAKAVRRRATVADIEERLAEWLAQYVADDPDAPGSAEFPLRDAQIEVTAKPGSATPPRITALLWPNYQLEPPPRGLRVVIDLPRG